MSITFDGFDLLAFIVLGVMLATLVVAIVFLGSLPGKIAAKRGHPYAAAVNVASWISFLTLGALWPLALIWAYLPWPQPSEVVKGGAVR
ncbi:MAG TPA: DUF3302 domain-containing protein [Pirellulales bacterium]|jgi:hypothetical protein|nr:DUF3302 domain-containing protein [Pirellulales bacterium]